jgi:steroid delta-isomerase-like uncharacterized protein
MSTKESKALVRRYLEQIWGEHRLDRLGEFVTDDVVLHASPGAVGRENLKQRIMTVQSTFPDLEVTIEDELAVDSKVVHRICIRATHQREFMGFPPSGKTTEVTGMSIFRLANGKIVEIWSLSDLATMMQQIGALEQPTIS